MQYQTLFEERKSVRNFTNQEISNDDLLKILKAGQAGPTCVNSRDFEFIVIKNKDTLKKLSENNGKSAWMLPNANVAIMVCGNLNNAFEKDKDYWIIDNSIACQNIMLEAQILGIGSVMLGCYPQKYKLDGLIKIMNLPSHIIPLAIIALGYESKEEMNKPKNVFEENKVHYETFKEIK